MAAWPRAAHAQQPAMPVIGFLHGPSPGTYAPMMTALRQGLKEAGYVEGHNVAIEYRWAEGHYDRLPALAADLVRRQVAEIVTVGTPAALAAKAASSTIPIVILVGIDPVQIGLVASLNRPGGNVTGLSVLQPTVTGKYLSILRELKPQLARVAIMYNPESVSVGGASYMPAFMGSAKEFNVTPIEIQVHSTDEIETGIASLGTAPGSALIVLPDNFNTVHRQTIISLAAQWRIPTIYAYRYFADEGGLLSYGVDVLDLFRRAPDYVDRILHGANPADLPVQAPRKFELVINLKTARTLGLVVPRILLAGADALIE